MGEVEGLMAEEGGEGYGLGWLFKGVLYGNLEKCVLGLVTLVVRYSVFLTYWYG